MENYKQKLEDMQQYVLCYERYKKERENFQKVSGEIVKFLRSLTKMSLRKFADTLDISASYLSKVERGEEVLSPETARRILEMHGVK